MLLCAFVHILKTVFKSQSKSQVKKGKVKYLQFQSHVLVLFYKVTFPFSACRPLRLLLLWMERRHVCSNKDPHRPLQSTLWQVSKYQRTKDLNYSRK